MFVNNVIVAIVDVVELKFLCDLFACLFWWWVLFLFLFLFGVVIYNKVITIVIVEFITIVSVVFVPFR